MGFHDIATYGDNFTAICTTIDKLNSEGVFFNTNPLHFSVPLLLLQCALSSLVILFISVLLKPLHQPLVVSQILGSVVLGASGLARNASIREMIFPLRSFMLIDVVSSLAFMFYFFLVGVQMDPWMLLKIDKKTSAIGCSAVVLPIALTSASYFLFVDFPNADPRLKESLPVITQAESVLAFPTVAYILSELKIVNSDFGRIAISASTVSALCCFSIITFPIIVHQTPRDNLDALYVLSAGITVGVVIIYVIRPAVLWMIRNHPEEQPVKESLVVVLFVGVLLTGFYSQATGLFTYFAPLALGMALPTDPPLGSALTEKLHFAVSWMLMPIYFLKKGMLINIFEVRFNSYFLVQFIALVAAMGKFFGPLFTSLYCEIPLRDAAALGLLFNAQGILEFGMFIEVNKSRVITHEAFVIMTMYLVIVTGITTPLVRLLYDPSRKYIVYERRTVALSKPHSELRVLLCIHDQENVPISINLLEALKPTKQSPLKVCLLHLIEHSHWARPRLISHILTAQPSHHPTPSSSSSTSSVPVINAFTDYENANLGVVKLHPFISMSPCNHMHDDVCSIALKTRTSLIIIPFHRRLLPNGATESYRKAARILNENVLNKAPCSVAILVDRGLLRTSGPEFKTWSSSFHVAVLFLGGPDDREALAIAARMAAHSNINLTVIRLLENGNVNSGNVQERRLDNEVVGLFRIGMTGNLRVMYVEEVVRDGSGTASVIRSLEQNYELVIVGRRHDRKSALVSALSKWSEQRQLGAIGEFLASKEFASNATILVVQQHITFVKERKAMSIHKKLTHLYSQHDDSTRILDV